MTDYKILDIEREVYFKTTRSGGKGGQHVNKVETKVEAWWSVTQSTLFDDNEKERILQKLANKINKDGFLICTASDTRSQLENKLIALKKLQVLITHSLIIPKKRKASKPTKASVEKRLESKKKQSAKKINRSNNSDWK
ncbi:MAG: alternative ribosome rescue aminoacyl-tRNA hydrolase ArfB [Bacteroidota bacterium]|jgi:ribosome-associated protein